MDPLLKGKLLNNTTVAWPIHEENILIFVTYNLWTISGVKLKRIILQI